MNAMNELDALETSAVGLADGSEIGKAEENPRLAEAEALKAVYPDFDPAAELEHPVLGALLRGEAEPTLRQLYEAVHWEEIAARRTEAAVEAAVETAVETAVAEAVAVAVADAVKTSEERLLGHIRARGRRPSENGTDSSAGGRLHPAVERLTRRERAILAKRAENGEHIRF